MRKKYLDNIRWITVVIVVIYHVFYMYNAEGILGGLGKITNLNVQPYDVFQYFVYPWIMPVLFLVAGISSRLYLERHTNKEFIKSRTRKLLVPSTIGLFVFQFLQGYVSLSLGTGLADISNAGVPKPVIFLIMCASGSGVLWFIHLLWIYSMLLLLLRKIEKGKLLNVGSRTPVWAIVLFYFPIWGAAQILNTPIISVYRFALCFVVCNGLNYADKPINRNPLFAACAYVGSLAMLGGMARFGDFSNQFTEWMSKKSFGLYVFHYLGISTVALFIAKPGLLPAPACYLLSLAAGFTFGYGLYEIISRIPFFRWAVLGIKIRHCNRC